jgi:glycosyltransferase involved in cell wall biosynthesis
MKIGKRTISASEPYIIAEIGVNHDGDPARALALIRLAAAGFFGYSTLPLRLATWLGLLAAASALVYGLYVIVTKLGGQSPPPGWASLALLVVFFGGIQLICIGIVGEYIGRIYQQVQGRPLYVVARETEL